MSEPPRAPSPNAPGWFVTLDGVDGSGKSTQIARIVDSMTASGRAALAVRDPGSTEIGGRLREILLGGDLVMHRRTEAMLFMAARCEMIETVIRPALADGVVVVSDRFLLSTVVYQSVAEGGVDAETLWQMGRLACGGLHPDLTILLDLPAEVSVARWTGDADRMERRGLDYMRAVRNAYRHELPRSGGEHVMVDASPRPDVVAAEIGRILMAHDPAAEPDRRSSH